MPAEPAYAALLASLGDRVDGVAKDLEVYAGDQPPPDYSLGTEAQGILREADAHGFDRFHLVGYSGGGAAALAFAAEPRRAASEPGAAWNRAGRATSERRRKTRCGTSSERSSSYRPTRSWREFTRLQLAPGVEPGPPAEGPPPPWMAKRPAGMRAFLHAFDDCDLDLEALRAFDRPVYFALGGRSNPDLYGRMAERLATIFPDFTLETFPERHHFDPPHRIEPDRLASSLLAFWERAEP